MELGASAGHGAAGAAITASISIEMPLTATSIDDKGCGRMAVTSSFEAKGRAWVWIPAIDALPSFDLCDSEEVDAGEGLLTSGAKAEAEFPIASGPLPIACWDVCVGPQPAKGCCAIETGEVCGNRYIECSQSKDSKDGCPCMVHAEHADDDYSCYKCAGGGACEADFTTDATQ